MISRFICIVRPQQMPALRQKAAIASMCFVLCRTCWVMWTGKTKARGLRDRIIKALDETIMPGISDHVEHDFWMTLKISKQIIGPCMEQVFPLRQSFPNRHGSVITIVTRIFLIFISRQQARIPVQGCQACFVLLKWLSDLLMRMKSIVLSLDEETYTT